MKLFIPKTNSIVLFIFTFVFVFVRAFDEYTQFVTRIIIPLFGIISIFRGGSFNVVNNKVFKFYVFLFLWSLLTVTIATSFDNYLRYTQLFIGVIILSLILSTYLRREQDLFALLWGVVLGVLLILVQGLLSGDISNLVTSSSTNERAEGIADNANTFGSFLLLASFSIGILYLRQKVRFIFLLVFLLAFGFGIIQTASRSSFLGFVIVLFYIAFHSFSKWPTRNKIITTILVLTFLIISFESIFSLYNNFVNDTLLGYRIQREDSASDDIRASLLSIGIQMIIDNPITGVGSGNFTNNNKLGFYSHNDFIEVFATLGIIGFAFYLTFIVKVFKLFKDLIKKYEKKGWIGGFGLFFLFTYLIQGLFKPLFIDVFWMFILLSFVILSVKISNTFDRTSNQQT